MDGWEGGIDMFELELNNSDKQRNVYKPYGTLKTIKVAIGGFIISVVLSVNVSNSKYERTESGENHQIEIVQRIISHEGAFVVQDMRDKWQKDLDEISVLTDNWDEEGASRIDRTAILNASRIVSSLDKNVAKEIRLYPTPLGAVMLKLETDKGRLKGEIGDQLISYFVKRPSMSPEYHSFEEITSNNIDLLKSNLASLI